jgi:RNA polymerase sigma-70 factor (ECF subfamily)
MADAMSYTTVQAGTDDIHPDGAIANAIAAAGLLSNREVAKRHATVCAGAVDYMRDLRVYARALTKNHAQADDLVQGAILRALEASRQFTPGTNIRAWLFTILRNVLYNNWRSPVSHHVGLEDCHYAPTTAPTQEASLEFCDLRRAFAELGQDQRDALLLVGASGLDYKSAAVVSGCAAGTMKSRVSRGRATLRTLMDGGPLSVKRREVEPISTMDIAFSFAFAAPSAAHPLSARI